MRTLEIPLTAIVLTILLSTDSSACRCKDPLQLPTAQLVQKEVQSSVAVFHGTVIGMKIVGLERSFTFRVHKAWKGIRKIEVDVLTGQGYGDCGYQFKIGKTYLVYASGSAENLSTGICTRTDLFMEAQSDYDALGEPKWVAPEPKPKE